MAITVQALDPEFSATQRFLVTGGTVGDTITASIDNTSIATVSPASQTQTSGGVTFTVTGVSPGATTLHISDGSNTVPWTINISGAPVAFPANVTVGIGQSVNVTLTEANDPNAFSSIASASTAIASISIASNAEGAATFAVTGVAAGSTTINYNDGHGNTGSIGVTVVNAVIPQLVQKARNDQITGAPTATFPNNPVQGNLVVAIVFGNVSTTPGSGWTFWGRAAGSSAGTVSNQIFSLFTRVVQFGDAPSLSPCGSSSGPCETYLLEYEGVNTANPFNCAAYVQETLNNVTRFQSATLAASWDSVNRIISTPYIIPNTNGCLALYIGGYSGGAEAADSTAYPALQQPNYTDTWTNMITAAGATASWSGGGSAPSLIGGLNASVFSNSYGTVGGPAANVMNQCLPFSLELVFGSTSGTTGQTVYCVGFNDGSDAGHVNSGLIIYMNAAGTWGVNINGFVGVVPELQIFNGEGGTTPHYCHVVITYDGTNLTAYVDGILQSTVNCGTIYIDPNSPSILGARAHYSSTSSLLTYDSYFQGNINAYACYSNILLTHTQIWQHYQAVNDIYNGVISSPLEDAYQTLFWDDCHDNPYRHCVVAQRETVTTDTTTPQNCTATLSAPINLRPSGYDASVAGLFFLNPAVPPPPPIPPTVSGRAKLIIKDKAGNLVVVADGAGMVGSSFVDEVNGGNTTATVVLNRKFIDTTWLDYGYRVQFWLPDSVDPWWDGRVVDFDPEQQQNSEFLTLQCEGWHTRLADAIVTEELNPGLQPNGVNNGTMAADVYLAHLLAIYVDAATFGASYLAPAPMTLDKMSFDGTELNRCIDTVVKSIEDNSGHTYEWWARGLMTQGQPGDGKPGIVVQPNQIPNQTAGVGYALITGRIAPTLKPVTLSYNFEFKDSTIYDFKIQNSSVGLYNMIALYGGKDPSTQQQVYGPFKDSTSISLYGLRQKKVTKSDLLSTTSLNNYAAVWLLLHAYPQPQGTFKCFIPHDARRAGRWSQIFIPGDSQKKIAPKISQVRTVKVTTSILDTERIAQEVTVTAPRPYIDAARYEAVLGAIVSLGTSTKRLNTTSLENYFVADGMNWTSSTQGTSTTPPSVAIDAPTGYFNSTASVSASGATVTLQDTVTGANGPGRYEVNFASNVNAVLGTGIAGPGLFCTKIAAGGAPVFGYDNRVLKGFSFTVNDSGQIIGSTDQRVLGGVSTANLKDGAVTVTKLGTGVLALANDSDVHIVSPTNGQVLTYVAADQKWENVTLAGDTDSLATLTDVTLTSPADNQTLQYNTAAGKWENQNLTVTEIAALPTAGSTYRGQIVRVLGNGTTTPDMLYVCRQRADGSYIWTRWQGRAFQIKLCSADFTPTATGVDLGGLFAIPYDPDENSDISVTWKVVKLFFRVETQGSTGTSVQVQRSTGLGNFSNAGYLNTTALTIPASTNEATTRTFAQTTVNSGDKLMAEYTALGTGAAGYTLILTLRES